MKRRSRSLYQSYVVRVVPLLEVIKGRPLTAEEIVAGYQAIAGCGRCRPSRFEVNGVAVDGVEPASPGASFGLPGRASEAESL